MAQEGEIPKPRNLREWAIYYDGVRAGKEAAKAAINEAIRMLEGVRSRLEVAPRPPAEVSLSLEARVDNPALGLSKQTYLALRRHGGIDTLADLTSTDVDDIAAIRNVGPKRLQEIRVALASFGMKLRGDE